MIPARDLAAQFVARCEECDGTGGIDDELCCPDCLGHRGRSMGIDAIAAAIEARDGEWKVLVAVSVLDEAIEKRYPTP